MKKPMTEKEMLDFSMQELKKVIAQLKNNEIPKISSQMEEIIEAMKKVGPQDVEPIETINKEMLNLLSKELMEKFKKGIE